MEMATTAIQSAAVEPAAAVSTSITSANVDPPNDGACLGSPLEEANQIPFKVTFKGTN